MKTKLHSLFIVLALSAGLPQVTAQGTAFTYQGRLNNAGSAASGNYDLTFTLYATNSTGAVIAGPLTNAAVSLTNGLFTTLVDFGNAFTGTNYWLEIAVSPNGADSFTKLSPRQQLTPVPYAIFAASAGNIAGTLPAGSLAGEYGNAVTLDNAANSFTGSFSGDGTSVANVNAVTLNGLASASFWQLGGNAGANPTNGAFLGTSDDLPLELWVNTNRALRLEYAYDPRTELTGVSPNIIAGCPGNAVSNGIYGALVAGGGNVNFPNRAGGNYAAVLGGFNNQAIGDTAVVMGNHSTASGGVSTAVGNDCVASGNDSLAAGSYANAAHNGSFVWGDSSSTTPFSDAGANQFLIRASGGVGIGTSQTPPGGLNVAGGGLAVTGTSSPNYPGAKGVFIESEGSFGAMFAFDYTASHSLPLCLNTPGGDVGIGTSTPDATLTVNGSADKPGGGSWSTFSDARLKDVGGNFTPGLAALEKIQPVHYHYKTDNALSLPSQPEYIGVVAQQLQQAVPEAVQTNSSGYLTVNNDPVLWTTVNAVKELQAENAELKARLDRLEKLLALKLAEN